MGLVGQADSDLLLVIGLIVVAFAIPATISAFADSRSPRFAAIVALVGGGLVLLGFVIRPGGYTPGLIPEAFASVIARLLH